jgi:hypothetical protein
VAEPLFHRLARRYLAIGHGCDAYVEAAFDLALEAVPATTVADAVAVMNSAEDDEKNNPMQALYDAYSRAQGGE